MLLYIRAVIITPLTPGTGVNRVDLLQRLLLLRIFERKEG
jgi:hypothetical protein